MSLLTARPNTGLSLMNANNENTPGKPLLKSSNPFPVVGIGASAGGLDAFRKLLKAIPEDSGMAYVLVQHLHPQQQKSVCT